MKSLKKFLLISNNMHYIKTSAVAFCKVALILTLTSTLAYANACIDCHTNPKYKKEDIGKLKKCLACHDLAGHPYKDVKTGLVGTAYAENKEIAPDIRHHPSSAAGASPDIKNMILIPGGEFLMGTDDRLRDEKPLYVVYINPFYIDKFEVTNEEYKKFVDAASHPAPDNWENNIYPAGRGKHPVIFVSWNDATAYCAWSGKRLPRETEWEKAARSTDGRIYPWGNEFDSSKANTSLSGIIGAVKVGTYEYGQSPYGVYDMAGNVWEWTNSKYDEGRKVVRGGSWGLSHRFARTFTRVGYKPDVRINNLGFRCAKDK